MNDDDDLDRLFRTTLRHDTADWQPPHRRAGRAGARALPRVAAVAATVVITLGLAAGLLALHGRIGGGAGPASNGHHTPVASPSPTPAVSPSPTPVATPSPTAAGGPVPSGFVPVAGWGLADGTIWLLGTAPCGSPPCTSMVRSLDGGLDWVGIPAPRTPLESQEPATGVSRLLFANAEDGWAYGPELWSTHDGGASWHQVSVAGGGILSAAVAGDQLVVAIGADSVQAGTVLLAHGPVTADDLTVTDQLSAGSISTALPPVELVGSASGAAWALTSDPAGGRLLSSVNGGGTWTAETYPCTQAPFEADEAAFAAEPPGRLVAACGGGGAAGSESKAVMTSSDGGSIWSTVAVATLPSEPSQSEASTQVLLGGELSGIAADGSAVVVASSSGGSELDTSADEGVTWAQNLGLASGGTPWTSLVFLNATTVLAVTADVPLDLVPGAYISTDAGASWTVLDVRG